MNNYSRRQYILFRIIFGLYLTVHFYQLLEYIDILFSNHGLISNPDLIPTWSMYSVIFFWVPIIDQYLNIIMITTIIVSFLFTIGIYTQKCAVFIWIIWSYLINRNPFIMNPGIPYVGWLLMVYSITSSQISNRKWSMHPILYWGAWFLVASGYTISGIHKLQCQSWIDGSALEHILSSALAHNNWCVYILLEMPTICLKIMTWTTLILEITFLPFGIFYYTRIFYWIALLFFHCIILMTINFADLTFGVLMIHFFIFDSNWLNLKTIKKLCKLM